MVSAIILPASSLKGKQDALSSLFPCFFDFFTSLKPLLLQ